MLAIKVVDYSLDGFFEGDRVAEDSVIESLLKGVDNLGGGGEIHVGHPEWEDVAALVFVPFEASVASSVGASVEIVFHDVR